MKMVVFKNNNAFNNELLIVLLSTTYLGKVTLKVMTNIQICFIKTRYKTKTTYHLQMVETQNNENWNCNTDNLMKKISEHSLKKAPGLCKLHLRAKCNY